MTAPRTLAALTFLALSPTLPSAQAPDGGEAPHAAESGDVFVVSTAGMDALMRSPKDRGLVEALHLLGARLAELPGELDSEGQFPPALLPLLGRLSVGPMTLRGGVDPADEQSPFPFYARLEVPPAEGQAPFAEHFEELMAQAGLPLEEPDAEGRVMLPLPLPSWYRDRDGHFELQVGSALPADVALATPLLPDGAKPTARFDFFPGRIAAALERFASNEEELAEMQEAFQFFGAEGTAYHWASGTDGVRGLEIARITEATSTLWGEFYSHEPLPLDALHRIPVDAEFATLSTWDVGAYVNWTLEQALTEIDPEGEHQNLFGEVLGVPDLDLQRDLLDPLGSVVGLFSSRVTGRGLYGAIGFVAVDDPATFANTLTHLEERVNELALEEAKGYVVVHRRDADGVRMASLRFPGLPIPFEPAYALADGYLVAGVSVRAVETAIAHARGDGPSLVDAPGFLPQLGGDPSTALAISYFDVPGLLDDGFAAADLVATMLSNSVRSRAGAAELRDPAPVLPGLPELRKGALPWVSIGWLEGDDFVSVARTDSSAVVNLTAIVPYFAEIYAPVIFGSIAAGAAVARTEAAVGAAEYELVMAELERLHAALDHYAIDNGAEYPRGLRALFHSDEGEAPYLEDGRVPVDPWGTPYRYERPTENRPHPRVFSLGPDGQRGGGDDLDRHSPPPSAREGLLRVLGELFD